MVKHSGTSFNLGDKDYVLPAANLRVVKQVQAIGKEGRDPTFEEAIGFVLQTFQRNYPDMTIEVLEINADLEMLGQMTLAMLSASGMEKVLPGEGDAKSL
jgi:hypothetical protein